MNARQEPDVPAWTRRGDLLVPTDLVIEAAAADLPQPGTALVVVPAPAELAPTEPETTEPQTTEPRVLTVRAVGRWGRERESARQLRERLGTQLAVTQAGRDHEIARRTAQVEHDLALADVAEQVTAAKRARRQREQDAAEADALAVLYRRASRSGARARVAAQIGRTAEMRALRVAAIQRVSLWTGLALLVGFGGWSTAGVHDGLVRLLRLAPSSVGWWAGWIVEPLLITIVAGLIVIRALLRTSGGDVDNRAKVAEGVALGTSLALNMLGGWHTDSGSNAEALGQALAHSVGAIGAAGTAWLIGVVIDYTTTARPWDGAPRVADLDLSHPMTAPADDRPGGINREKLTAKPRPADGLPDDVRTLLDDVRAAITDATLPTDPSGYAIYKHVMAGRGDKARAGKVAALVAGWRPGPRAVHLLAAGAADVAS